MPACDERCGAAVVLRPDPRDPLCPVKGCCDEGAATRVMCEGAGEEDLKEEEVMMWQGYDDDVARL